MNKKDAHAHHRDQKVVSFQQAANVRAVSQLKQDLDRSVSVVGEQFQELKAITARIIALRDALYRTQHQNNPATSTSTMGSKKDVQ